MGRVRAAMIKRLGKELVEKYRDQFSDDFEHNKKALEGLVAIPSKVLRNKLAGYITALIKAQKREQASQE